MTRRAPNGSSSIYQGNDGLWHTWVHAGRKVDGQPDRRHIKRRTAGEVKVAAEELRERLARGQAAVGKAETVEQWLTYWLENVVEPGRAYKTHAGYRSLIVNHVIPHLGQWRLDGSRNRLEPEYVEKMYARLAKEDKLAPSYVLQIHRVLRKALKDAARRGRAARNVCDLIDPPRARRGKVDAHSLEDAQAILAEAVKDRMAARWLIGMLLGPRQGEAIGLRWHRVHLDAKIPYITVAKQLQRWTWRHGCDDPAGCASSHCRTRPCPPRYSHGCAGESCGKKLAHFCPGKVKVAGCSRHSRPCPPPCPKGCARHASSCPKRRDGGLVDVDVKSEKGDRDIPLPPLVVELLRQVREEQIRIAPTRGAQWDPQGLVFVNVQGRAIDPRRDHQSWEELLQRAGVADSRLHAARHTAATFMVGGGVDIRVVQELLGHSRITVTEGYTDVAQEIKRQAVNKIASALMDGQLTALLEGPKMPSQRVPEA